MTKMDSTGITELHYSNPEIPTSWREGQAGNSSSDYDRIAIYKNIEDTPGGTPEIYVIYMNNGGEAESNPVNIYRWRGYDQELDFIGSVGEGLTWSWVHDGVGGGQYTFAASGEYTVNTTLNSVNQTTIDLNAWVYGAPTGVNGVIAEWYYSKVGGVPDQRCTMQSVISGPGWMSGNYVAGLNTDGGLNVVRWNAAADGIRPNDRLTVVGRVFSWE